MERKRIDRAQQNECVDQLILKVKFIEKEKEELVLALNEKEKFIATITGNTFKCSSCAKYSKSMDEVLQATAKHRNTALVLKDVCEKQKNKIKEYQKEIDEYEVELTEQEEKVKQLEEDVNIGFNLNTKKREEIEKLHKKITGFEERENNTKGLVAKLEKKQAISEKVIASLRDKNDQFEKNVIELNDKIEAINSRETSEKATNTIDEFEGFVSKEIFEAEVKDYEIKLEIHRKREVDLEEEIITKNSELETLKDSLRTHELKSTTSSLADELELVKEKENLEKKKEIFNNLNKKLEILEIKIQGQKAHLNSSLNQLKLKEELSKNNCACKRFCRITHSKHNWKRSKCEEIIEKLITCNVCEEIFVNQSDVKMHIERDHKERVKDCSGEVEQYSETGGLS